MDGIWFYAAQNLDPEKGAPGHPGPWILSSDPNAPGYMFRTVHQLKPVRTEKTNWGERPVKGIVHDYHGPFVFDIDINPSKKIVTVEDSLKIARACATVLENYGLNRDSGMEIYFSGSKGYHISVPPEAFGIRPGEFVRGLPFIYKQIAAKLNCLTSVDGSMYSVGLGKMFRLPNVKRAIAWDEHGNPVFGPCKVQLTWREFMESDAVYHAQIAREPRSIRPAIGQPCQALVDLFEESGATGKKLRA